VSAFNPSPAWFVSPRNPTFPFLTVEPQTLTRLDWQRFSRFFGRWGLPPQTPALGFTPAQTRAKEQALWTPIPLALAFTLPRRLSTSWKGIQSGSAFPVAPG